MPNHSSDQHPWFLESRSSRDNPKRDWYVWRDPTPNDWLSVFEACGKAWTFDETTEQYYLHSFMPEQPDLNWDNPEVEQAMHDVLRFWMDRGVDGLRLDAIAKIAKDPQLRDHVGAPRRHDEDWESIHPRLRGIRKVIDEYDDRMIVGEVALQDLHRVVAYLGYGDQLHLAHNFVFIDQEWDADAYATSIDDFEAIAEDQAWPAWFLANHDKPRPRSRFDHDGLGAQRARAILLMLYTLRGTPFIYQGEELGLPDATIPPDRVVDVDGRDPERAPIPWTPRGAGPRLHAGDAVAAVRRRRRDAQRRDAGRRPGLDAATSRERLATLRAGTPGADHRHAGARRRRHRASSPTPAATNYLVAINFTDQALPLAPTGELVVSSDPHTREASASLKPSEALILQTTAESDSPESASKKCSFDASTQTSVGSPTLTWPRRPGARRRRPRPRRWSRPRRPGRPAGPPPARTAARRP